MPTLHVHRDESGDLNFFRTGTEHYVFAVTWTYEPLSLATRLNNLRFDLVKMGHDLPRFHAHDDPLFIRDMVLTEILAHRGWRYAAVVVKTRELHPAFNNTAKFYADLGSMPFHFVFRGFIRPNTHQVLIYSDQLLSLERAHRELIKKSTKTAVRAELPKAVRFQVYFHPSGTNAWLQVTDYCCWAVLRKWEHKDPRMYNRLLPHLAAPEQVVP